MLDVRSSGVLCHISSLPSPFGIGDLGPGAYRFADFLARAGQHWWQVLPLAPTEPALANSPYSSFSAFAGNPLFISPELLVKDGFLEKKDLDGFRVESGDRVDYDKAGEIKTALLNKAYQHFCQRRFKIRDFQDFCKQQAYWLDDLALFTVLKHHFHDACWNAWIPGLRDRDPEVLRDFADTHPETIERVKFIQYLFHRQWRELQGYCSRKGVGFIGDIPIYVNYDSVDVWVNPEFFKLDDDRKPTFVAGVPPDYFSKDGQCWGNPVYDWRVMKESSFAWWVRRLRRSLGLFDAVRIDHFRGFAQCWEIPVAEKTAIKGMWCDVPGEDFFRVLQGHFPRLPVIAEDLGIITEDVTALKEKFGFPGMRVLMFAFHDQYKKSRDLPDNYTSESVVYTGTHDNNTLRGWFEEDMLPAEKKNLDEYLGRDVGADDVNWVMIDLAMRSSANISIIPLQDLLGLGREARMNRPSTVRGN